MIFTYEELIFLTFILKEEQENQLSKKIIEKINKYLLKPQFFVIKRNKDNHLWKDYISWMNKKYKNAYSVDNYNYYGFDSEYVFYNDIKEFNNNPILLSLEMWKELFIYSK